MTVLSELRELQVAKVLLQLVSDRNISEQGKSVAEWGPTPLPSFISLL